MRPGMILNSEKLIAGTKLDLPSRLAQLQHQVGLAPATPGRVECKQGVIGVEGDCRLELELGFGQTVLQAPQLTHRHMRRRPTWIAFRATMSKTTGSIQQAFDTRPVVISAATRAALDIRNCRACNVRGSEGMSARISQADEKESCDE